MSSIPELRPNDDGVFYAYWSDARRSKRKSMGTSDPAVAEERFAQWLLIRGSARSDDKERRAAFTCGDCWFVYRNKHVLKNTASPITADYSWQALEPHFGKLLVAAFDQGAVDSYVRARTTGRKAVKPQTARRELQALLAALNFCARPAQKMLSSHDIAEVEIPVAGQPRDRWLTDAEIAKVLQAAVATRKNGRLSRVERFLWIALYTAARKAAVLDLTWNRVDFDIKVIHLDVPGRKKTNKRRVSVPIATELLPILQRAYDERVGDLVLDNKAAVWASVQRVVINAGLGGKQGPVPGGKKPKSTGISPHTLRHTAATQMARRNVPIFKIAKILGDSIATVEKHYAKYCPDDLRDAVDQISQRPERAA